MGSSPITRSKQNNRHQAVILFEKWLWDLKAGGATAPRPALKKFQQKFTEGKSHHPLQLKQMAQ